MKPRVLPLVILFLVIPALAVAQGVNAPSSGGAIAPPTPPKPNQRIPFLIPFPGPSDPLHFNSNTIPPTMPWVGITNPNQVNYGAVVRSIEVPPQQVEIQVYVPGAGSFSGGLEPQTVEIPGYVVTETTAGYIYPQRWGLQQVTAGVYQWVALPQQFQPK